jgi:putative hydrolase of the HAD superfamily
MSVRAVFFDVDFTLIHPGPTFRGEGYQAFCARYGISVDPATFEQATASAASLLDQADDGRYDHELFVGYTRHIIERMGGCGEQLDACAREIYREWAACQHFDLYDDAPAVLRRLAGDGMRIGLISNSHRCLASFESHFELHGLIAGAVSSSEFGYMKPHPSIFEAALKLVGVAPHEAVMVGDTVRHDIEGARGAGMFAVLIHRGSAPHPRAEALAAAGVPTVHSLDELPALLAGWPPQAASPEQVQVDVEHRLAGVAVGVEDGPEPRR